MKRDFYTKLFLVVAICSTTYKSFGLSSEKNELELRAERESFKIYEYYKNNPEYFDFDLRKYRTSKRKAIIGAGFFSINIGVTIILAMAASPIIFSPIANGVRTTTRTLKKYISNCIRIIEMQIIIKLILVLFINCLVYKLSFINRQDNVFFVLFFCSVLN